MQVEGKAPIKVIIQTNKQAKNKVFCPDPLGKVDGLIEVRFCRRVIVHFEIDPGIQQVTEYGTEL